MSGERRAEGRVALATILVVDDALTGRKALREALEAEGFAVVEATDGEHAVEAARHESPDVIVVAASLGKPPNGSLDALALLRESGRHVDTPMLVPSSPADPHEVAGRVREEAIKAAARRDLADDWLASLPDAAQSLAAPLSSVPTLTVFVVGVDDFHRINYEHGQLVGLAVLRIAGRRLASVVDGRGIVGRRGSEEFVVLLPGDDPDDVRAVAAELRQVVSGAPFSLGMDSALRVTVSVGILSTTMSAVEEAVAQATAALHTAQRDGRDRVSFG